MSDDARKKRERRIANYLAALQECDVTCEEAAVVSNVAYCRETIVDLARTLVVRSQPDHGAYHLCSFTLESAARSIEHCKEKGWIQLIDETWLAKMTSEYSAASIAGPLFGWPKPGEIDLTPRGSALRKCIHRIICAGFIEVSAERVQVYDNDSPAGGYFIDLYYPSIEKGLAAIEILRTESRYDFVGEPVIIGKWCTTWLDLYSSGVMVRVHEPDV